MTNLYELKEKVQRYLSDFVGTIELLADGRFAFDHGTTRLVVKVDQHTDPDYAFAIITAPTAFGVPATPELFKWLALNADGYLFGHLGCYLDDKEPTAIIVFSHTLLIDYLDAEELRRAVGAVAFTADGLDETIVGQFGGKRYIDS